MDILSKCRLLDDDLKRRVFSWVLHFEQAEAREYWNCITPFRSYGMTFLRYNVGYEIITSLRYNLGYEIIRHVELKEARTFEEKWEYIERRIKRLEIRIREVDEKVANVLGTYGT